LITVEDDSSYYFALDWSPDQKYISFNGSCSGKGCNKIYDIESQQVVWTSVGLPGAENGTYLNWAHDSKYIIVQSEGITIIDIKTGERIRNFEDLSGGVIVWTP
jgi:WD40 repeat protein